MSRSSVIARYEHARCEEAEAEELSDESASDLEDVYQKLLALSEAVEAMEELGVETATDLRELDEEDVIQLGAMLKKVHRNRLLRILGHAKKWPH